MLAALLGIAIHEWTLQHKCSPSYSAVVSSGSMGDALSYYQTGEESEMSESTSYFPAQLAHFPHTLAH